MTYDERTKTLFSSDLFGSYDAQWDLFFAFQEGCSECSHTRICPINGKHCPTYGIEQFHTRIMTSNRALSMALDVVESLDTERIAPQHGSILTNREDVKRIVGFLRALNSVGIDAVAAEQTP